MTSERGEIAQGLKMAGVAVASAVLTATLVIGAGEVWLSRAQAPVQGQSQGQIQGQTAQADRPAEAAPYLIRAGG